ncbi:MAG: hypothetical protein MUF38_06080 [Anaerolineae bacterium]|jgi:hypothetical protein|nr:hypothetical protein [Anaerolineae bacterium]
MQPTVIETVVFILNPGTDEATFLEAAKPTFDLIKRFPGYIRRDLTTDGEGRWVDIVYWADLDSALSASDQLMQSPVGQVFGRFINVEQMTMHHTTIKLSGAA